MWGGPKQDSHTCFSLLVQYGEIPQRTLLVLPGSPVAMATKSPLRMADSALPQALAGVSGLSEAGFR